MARNGAGEAMGDMIYNHPLIVMINNIYGLYSILYNHEIMIYNLMLYNQWNEGMIYNNH